MKQFSGKVAFITGGASGIGLAMASAFLQQGMRVVIADVRKEALSQAARELGADATRLHSIQLDVTDRAALAAAATEVERVFGKVHLLCPNAGVTDSGMLKDTTYEDWDWIVGVNLGGVVNTIATFLPRMLAHGEEGHVVVTASMGGLTPIHQSGVYCVAKNAVIGMTEALRMELAASTIGVSVLCPGLTRTSIFSAAALRPSKYSHSGYRHSATAPIEAAGIGDEVAQLAMDPVEVAERVLRGIRRNDLYILTHSELRELIQRQFDGIRQAMPSSALNEELHALPGQSDSSGIPTPYPTAIGRDP